MLKAIKHFIANNSNGLFFFDAPTGFGKTTAVIDYMEFLLLYS